MHYFCLILLTIVSINSLASTSKFECKYLDYNLVLEAKGFEHIVHELKINGKITVTELLDNHWFIESVNCQPWGYQIVTSHVQLSDPTQKVFLLTYNNKTGYKIVVDINQSSENL